MAVGAVQVSQGQSTGIFPRHNVALAADEPRAKQGTEAARLEGERADEVGRLGNRAASEAESEEAGLEQVTQAVDRINEMMQKGRNTLKFELDDDAGRMVVRVLDAETEELIRQIPSEETLKFAEYVEGLVGLIFNDQA
ncbi:flagellar protein FlaG [Thiorhodococcus minor]|uniref:Flagellar protein FlaG n=2 Tax=Thiorhodococcus minor TaxID=57489 RepID=A0A6M0JS07_9GAMM|nr:flagellar protein FlaG [Thiorhodococcus minor]